MDVTCTYGDLYVHPNTGGRSRIQHGMYALAVTKGYVTHAIIFLNGAIIPVCARLLEFDEHKETQGRSLS